MNTEGSRFCVYAIQSKASGRVFVGQTDDLARRLKEHNSGRVISTKRDVPWKILAFEVFRDRSQARWCESRLKGSKGKRLQWIDRNRI